MRIEKSIVALGVLLLLVSSLWRNMNAQSNPVAKDTLSDSEFQMLAARFMEEPTVDRIGPPAALGSVPVDVELNVSREKPVVGELWTVVGRVWNRSGIPVWITNTSSNLNVPPEIWGSTSRGGSIGAFFPTLQSGEGTEVVRIEPGKDYLVTWKVDTWRSQESGEDVSGWLAVMSKINVTLRDFLFYKPGNYAFGAIVHIWPAPPQLNNGTIVNPGESFTVTRTQEVFVDGSPWVLILGAIIGGLIAFFLRLLYTLRTSDLRTRGGIRYIVLGTSLAILLCSIGTVLASRVANADFLVKVVIQDFWGAIATGFILQWAGLSYFGSRLEALLDRTSESDSATPTPARPNAQSISESSPDPDTTSTE